MQVTDRMQCEMGGERGQIWGAEMVVETCRVVKCKTKDDRCKFDICKGTASVAVVDFGRGEVV